MSGSVDLDKLVHNYFFLSQTAAASCIISIIGLIYFQVVYIGRYDQIALLVSPFTNNETEMLSRYYLPDNIGFGARPPVSIFQWPANQERTLNKPGATPR